MKDVFKEYYKPTKTEFDVLWNKALVAFDANVLLHLLRFKQSSASVVLDVLTKLGSRAWLPNQAAEEFLKNRHGVFLNLDQPYSRLDQFFSKQAESANQELSGLEDQFRDHPSLDFSAVKSECGKAFQKLRNYLVEQQKKHPTAKDAEDILDKVTDIFSGKVASRPSAAQLTEWTKEAQTRFEKEIPPGYLDAKKTSGGFGDYFIWQQLIEKSKESGVPIIFVTDDVKEDWWLRIGGKTLGPRPELRKEFFDKTKQLFYMYSLREYLKLHNEMGGAVSEQVIQEAQDEAARAATYEALRQRMKSSTEQHKKLELAHIKSLEYGAQQELDIIQDEINTLKVELLKANNENRPAAEVNELLSKRDALMDRLNSLQKQNSLNRSFLERWLLLDESTGKWRIIPSSDSR